MRKSHPYKRFMIMLLISIFALQASVFGAVTATTSSSANPAMDSVPQPNSKQEPVAATTGTIKPAVPVLSYGSTGTDVVLLQTKLKKVGYFSYPCTGKYLTATKSAVSRFQKNSRLSPTGITGILTWNVLNKRTGGASNSRGQAIVSGKYSVFNRILKQGCVGNDVTALQGKLIDLGLLSGKKDGIYGKMTATSVKSFQTYKKMAANGTADELTISHLLNTNSVSADFLDKLNTKPGTSQTTPSAVDIPTHEPTQTMTPSPTQTPTQTQTPTPTSPTPISEPIPTDSASEVPASTTTGSGVVVPDPVPSPTTPDPGSDIPSTVYGSLAGKTIVIDPGHGYSDPGTSRASVYEKTITLNIGLKLKKKLEDAGAKVVMTRTGDSSNGLYYLFYRSAVANKVVLEQEIQKVDNDMQLLSQSLQLAEAEAAAKKAELDALSSSQTDVDAQKNLTARISLQQEYNLILQQSEALKAEQSKKESYRADLEFKMESLDLYINDPALKDRIGIYELQGSKAGSDLKEVLDLANNGYSKNTLFISIHVNSTEQSETSASGVKVYVSDIRNSYYSGYYAGYNQQLRDELGSLLLENLNLTTNFSKKTTSITKSNLSVLRENNLVSALVEVGFMNNSSDRKLLQQAATQENTALGILNGIKAYFEQK